MTATADPLALSDAGAILLDPGATAAAQASACERLHARCLAQLPALSPQSSALASGKALSPLDAATCVLDAVRTARLLQGVDAAIAARLAPAPDAGVDVLYAGCGPLAPLALALVPRYRNRGVRFTLVDIHASSLDAARRLFELCGAGAMLRATLCADAATLRLPTGFVPDVLIAEVMQRSLAHEPQVAVVANLAPQCARHVTLVPSCIRISASLGRFDPDPGHATAAPGETLGPVFELSLASLPAIATAIADPHAALPEIWLRVPPDASDGLSVWLHTWIEARPGLILADGDSGLTLPEPQLALGRVHPGEWLGFCYRLAHDPGFRVRRAQAR